MKIAFTSCMNISQRSKQPVWQHIAQCQPDYLVLLGDSIYADVPHPMVNGAATAVKDLDEKQLRGHLHSLYKEQLSEAHFSALIQKVPTFAIWDDHDFLGNGSRGGDIDPPMLSHVRATRAVFKAYQKALAAQDPSAFPATAGDPQLQKPDETAPGYQQVQLSDGVHLHLADGRSHKSAKTLLGPQQRLEIASNVVANPQAIHIIASPIVFDGNLLIEGWSHFDSDAQWLRDLAKHSRLLLISGDIHRNKIRKHALDTGKTLYEFTASGAAIDVPLRLPHWPTHNFGLLDFQGDGLCVELFSDLQQTASQKDCLPYSQL